MCTLHFFHVSVRVSLKVFFVSPTYQIALIQNWKKDFHTTLIDKNLICNIRSSFFMNSWRCFYAAKKVPIWSSTHKGLWVVSPLSVGRVFIQFKVMHFLLYHSFLQKKVLQFASLIDLLLFPHTWYLSSALLVSLFENNYFQSISPSKLHIDSSRLQKTVHRRFISFPSFKKRISFRHQTMQ